jgi:magnesium chelatase family protein
LTWSHIKEHHTTRAHRGALFLDELAEFAPSVLDALRQPLEERVVRISRQAMTLTFPADFVLVGCCNPCPCGRGDAACGCNEVQRQRYRRRISAPLLDRFDLRLHVRPPAAATPPGPTSSETAATVAAAVARQRQRYRDRRWKRNAHVPPGALALDIPLGPAAQATWRELSEERMLSARGAARVWRVARTLADLDDRSEVTSADVELAATLRDEVIT